MEMRYQSSFTRTDMIRNILYIATSFPALSHTFIYREVLELLDRGYIVHTASRITPKPDSVSNETKNFLSSTFYLDTIPLTKKIMSAFVHLAKAPKVVIRNVVYILLQIRKSTLLSSAKLFYHFIEACCIAKFARDQAIDHIHCHFADQPTSIGMFLSDLIDVPFSFTAHANDIFVNPVGFERKLDRCKFALSISDYNRKYLLDTYGKKYKAKIRVIHCGLKFPFGPLKERNSNPGYLRILTVGRMVPKKGFDVLIRACALLKKWEIPFKCTIVGDGDDKESLLRLVSSNKLGDDVSFAGAVHHENLKSYFLNSDVFVLPCLICKDGDRDGIPVALMEAMAYKIPVISSNIVGIPELVDHNINGFLIPEGNVLFLAEHLRRLYDDPSLGINMGENGYNKVNREFNISRSVSLFEAYLNN